MSKSGTTCKRCRCRWSTFTWQAACWSACRTTWTGASSRGPLGGGCARWAARWARVCTRHTRMAQARRPPAPAFRRPLRPRRRRPRAARTSFRRRPRALPPLPPASFSRCSSRAWAFSGVGTTCSRAAGAPKRPATTSRSTRTCRTSFYSTCVYFVRTREIASLTSSTCGLPHIFVVTLLLLNLLLLPPSTKSHNLIHLILIEHLLLNLLFNCTLNVYHFTSSVSL